MGSEVTEKVCNRCKDLKPASEFSKASKSADGLNWSCKSCAREQYKAWEKDKAEHTPEKEADRLVAQLESGEFQVDQEWLLKELIKLYKDPKERDKLGTLKMLANISGYNKDTGDERAIVASLMASMKGEPSE